MEKTTIHIPPFFIEVDGIQVEVLEVLKTTLLSGETWYHVVVSINYKGIKSRKFTLDVKDTQQLVNKLKAEIAKLKIIEYTYGIGRIREVMT